MSQDRQNPDHSDAGRLNIRIIGRTKEYEISKMVGETEVELKARVAEAVNTHPGSLNDEEVTIQPDDIEYVRARGGSFITQVKENHWQLSVKLCETAEEKLSHKKVRKDRMESVPKPRELLEDPRRGREGHRGPDMTGQVRPESRVDLDPTGREFKPLDLDKGAEQDTGEFAWSIYQMAATQLLRNIKGRMYAPETLESMSRITDRIKKEITTVQGGVATLGGSRPEERKPVRLEVEEEKFMSVEGQGERAGAELGNQYPVQIEMMVNQPAPTPDRTSFWKDLNRFLGYCPRDTGEDNTLLLPEISSISTEY